MKYRMLRILKKFEGLGYTTRFNTNENLIVNIHKYFLNNAFF